MNTDNQGFASPAIAEPRRLAELERENAELRRDIAEGLANPARAWYPYTVSIYGTNGGVACSGVLRCYRLMIEEW
jgi:hypothetical protein